jgi:hypothetical protein
VRILATTNRDLSREVDAGRFRGDLFFRLNVLPVRMPALRERLDDVQELAEHFLGLVADREGGRRKKLAKDALALFAEYAWPGNVREAPEPLRARGGPRRWRRGPRGTRRAMACRERRIVGIDGRDAASVAPSGGVGVRLSRPEDPGGSRPSRRPRTC